MTRLLNLVENSDLVQTPVATGDACAHTFPLFLKLPLFQLPRDLMMRAMEKASRRQN
jgi:hypothetical protein